MPRTLEGGGRRRSGLVARLVLLTTGVAGVAVLLAGLVSLGLVRSAAQSQARRQLARQADGYAAVLDRALRPRANPATVAPRLTALLRQQGITLVGLRTDGSAIGGDANLVPADVASAVVAGQRVSAIRDVAGHRRYLEGRPLETAAGEVGGIVLVQNVAQAAEITSPVLDRLLIALGIGLLGAAAAGALLASRLARPLQAAARAAHALAVGRRDVRVPVRGPAELAEVADAMNRLTTALAHSEGRQREFLLSVSHELRTPLTAVIGHAEALADGVIDGTAAQQAGGVIADEARRLDRLVRDLLDLARLGADDFRVDFAPVDLRALVLAAADVWRTRCSAEGVELRVEVPAAPLVAVTDAGRVRQILDGLAENALRVVPAGRPIVFAVAPAGSDVVLAVRDGGPGLTDEDCAVAFERSALYERYRGIRRVGTGLGLALVAGLAEKLGGRASAGHAPEGGAAFSVRLPQAGPVAGARPAAASRAPSSAQPSAPSIG